MVRSRAERQSTAELLDDDGPSTFGGATALDELARSIDELAGGDSTQATPQSSTANGPRLTVAELSELTGRSRRTSTAAGDAPSSGCVRERAYLLGVPTDRRTFPQRSAGNRVAGAPAQLGGARRRSRLMAVVIAATATSGRRHGRTDPSLPSGRKAAPPGPHRTTHRALSPRDHRAERALPDVGRRGLGGGTTGAVRLPEAANPVSASATVEPTTSGHHHDGDRVPGHRVAARRR